ncbi:hypothetical protein AVEN_263547-1 [Araneus ventricosus]|uniref:Uncharacterized protein n=1 Tax=Araneus ventricosus TaxID=182803 RepID=A0A4Y2PI75_ARAVE|nr:hypothetical protein AVEN_263547-1 [Araneus ventricosus]
MDIGTCRVSNLPLQFRSVFHTDDQFGLKAVKFAWRGLTVNAQPYGLDIWGIAFKTKFKLPLDRCEDQENQDEMPDLFSWNHKMHRAFFSIRATLLKTNLIHCLRTS